ncbi:hypothetical protein BKN14_04795 [Candidatus Gracilibacteria bacterium HOT-871]|nr:hypothetical protein BKN14_04795 [Candidatus Gracilibacteria bacterium HOT-871]MBB1565096.1 hypothetical protein [Candidatus Gracilibacteria bacterium]RKW20459.1 MAG: hypothetical protein D8B46_09600 [Candidatus Gracilibacteria bacterium]
MNKKKYIIWSIVLIIVLVFFYALGKFVPVNDLMNSFGQGTFVSRMLFFLILVPAAIGDSINPCEFAIMFILLQTVLRNQKSRGRVILVGLSFILSIFLSYFLMGLGLYTALTSISGATETLKIIAGILGIVIGLANLKDYFWYGKYFKMEVPNSWRPKMRKIIKGITSPIGAFGIGILISLFLLPCTSGPYITIIGLLSSESEQINLWGYIYLLVYNIIFIIPMFIIMYLVAFGVKDIAELKEMKELNVEKMHLVTGIIMLALGIYVLYDVFKLYF